MNTNIDFKTKVSAERFLKKPIDLDTLSRNRARVVIAKDILAQLKVRKFVAQRGAHMSREWVLGDNGLSTGQVKACMVCAIGAAACALFVRQGNDLARKYMGRYEMTRLLKPYFDERELNAMEEYFEDGHTDGPVKLKKICKRIIKSRGKEVVGRRLAKEYGLVQNG